MSRIVLAVTLLAAAPAALACGGCARPASADPPPAQATATATLDVQGMTCAACGSAIKTACKKLDGVATVDVDVAGGQATVTFDPGKVSAEDVARKINDLGYKAKVQPSTGG
jgi:copper ion binding protein